jgi:hypothetical protein
MLLLGVVQAQAAGDEFVSSYDLLATEILTGTAASVTFSSLGDYATDYQHLQLRAVVRGGRNDNPSFIGVRFNADSSSIYDNHSLQGNGSSVTSSAELNRTNSVFAAVTGTTGTANAFGAIVYDILDPFETTKNTTGRSLSGLADSANQIRLGSTLYRSTSSITSIEILNLFGVDLSIGSRFSLYGLKGSA